MPDNNVTINGPVNVKQARGAGTVLLVVFFGWALVFIWWPITPAYGSWVLVQDPNLLRCGFFARIGTAKAGVDARHPVAPGSMYPPGIKPHVRTFYR